MATNQQFPLSLLAAQEFCAVNETHKHFVESDSDSSLPATQPENCDPETDTQPNQLYPVLLDPYAGFVIDGTILYLNGNSYSGKIYLCPTSMCPPSMHTSVTSVMTVAYPTTYSNVRWMITGNFLIVPCQ